MAAGNLTPADEAAMNDELKSLFLEYQALLESAFLRKSLTFFERRAQRDKDIAADCQVKEELRREASLDYLLFKGLADGEWIRAAYNDAAGGIRAKYHAARRAAELEDAALTRETPAGGASRGKIRL